MSLFVLSAWLLQHPYAGLVHDSVLYTLMALERLHPDTLSHDVFLRFGSQDQYTIFGPVYAAAIRLLDLEPAAALLTLLSQCALFGFAWLLARRFMPGTLALLATGLLIALPSNYGCADFFHYTENFLTPRLPAEALVLAAIIATLSRRYWLTAACMLAALLLHPLMSMAGLAMLTFTFVAIPRPRLALGCGAFMLTIPLLASLWGIAPFVSFASADEQWLGIIRASSPFLFVSPWSVTDWVRITVPLAVLTIGLLTATTTPLRRLCAGAILTGISGLVLTTVYCDALKIILITELQPWRWLWLTNVVALLLSPLIAITCWRSGSTGRAAILLLLSAWLLRDDTVTVITVLLAIICAAARYMAVAKKYAKVALLGSCALLFIVMAINLADKYSLKLDASAADSIIHRVTQWLYIWNGDGMVLGVVLILVCWAFERATTVTRTMPLVVAGAVVCATLGLSAWTGWTNAYYTPTRHAAFAAWRNEIPPQAEVLWPSIPVGAWYLLERPSYWSLYQSAGAVFSRQKAIELYQRMRSIVAATNATATHPNDVTGRDDADHKVIWAPPISVLITHRSDLQAVCKDVALKYVVSWTHVGPTPVDPVTPDPHRPRNKLYLYRCADFGS